MFSESALEQLTLITPPSFKWCCYYFVIIIKLRKGTCMEILGNFNSCVLCIIIYYKYFKIFKQ